MRAWKGELGSSLKGVLPKWHGSFQVRLTPSVIPSEVEESLILTITSSKRSLVCARHDKKPIWATGPLFLTADYTDNTDVMNRRKTKETKPLEATGPLFSLFSSLSYVQILWVPANRSIPDSGFYML